MGRFFEGFKPNVISSNVIWQEHESMMPYTCSQCRRDFPEGGKRYLASSLTRMSHNAAGCRCEDCNKGINPHRQKVPVYAERRTELD